MPGGEQGSAASGHEALEPVTKRQNASMLRTTSWDQETRHLPQGRG